MQSLALIQVEFALRLAKERAAENAQRAEHTRRSDRPRRGVTAAIATAISRLVRRPSIDRLPQPVTPILSDYPYRV
jgi:hypothetical protein